jgi:hypothetical protein
VFRAKLILMLAAQCGSKQEVEAPVKMGSVGRTLRVKARLLKVRFLGVGQTRA